MPLAPEAGQRTRPFGHLQIAYDDRVLRPRSWTTLQSLWAADLLGEASGGRILELCAGAGHIGLLAASLSGASLSCVDIDPHACEFARLNAYSAGLTDRVDIRCAPLEQAMRAGEAFDLVIADPPWVMREEIGSFPEDPELAIDGGADGLDVARACLVHARPAVVPGASMLVQLGDESQADRLVEGASVTGWRGDEVRRGARGVVVRLIAT